MTFSVWKGGRWQNKRRRDSAIHDGHDDGAYRGPFDLCCEIAFGNGRRCRVLLGNLFRALQGRHADLGLLDRRRLDCGRGHPREQLVCAV